jgi:hypothetical protein
MNERSVALQNHYLKNMTIYCHKKNNFINFIELQKFVFFEYLNIEDIKNLLNSLYYLTHDTNNIILLYINNIINNVNNFKSMSNQLYYLYTNINILSNEILNTSINKSFILTILLEKRTTLILDYINKIKKKFINYDDIIDIDITEYLYNNIYKFINDIRHIDEEYDISWDIIDSYIPYQYYHDLDNNHTSTNKSYSRIYNKIGNLYPTIQIIRSIQKYNSIILYDILDKLKVSHEMLISSKNVHDIKKYYEELTDNINKLPILQSHDIFNIFNDYRCMRPKLQYFKDKLFVIYDKHNKIVKDQNNEKIYIQSKINEYIKYKNEYEYIYENLNINNEYNLQINHSLEYILMEYKNNEFDFDIYIESISLDSITETINSELKKSFVLTDTIRETIKNIYLNNYCEYKINNQIIYVNDYIIYNYLKLELIKAFLDD